MTGGAVSGCADCSASQMGQDQISFKIPCPGKDSAGSTRLCIVQVAVGKPLRPKPWSSSIIFEVPPGFEVLALYARIALRLRTLSKRKLGRSFFFGWRSGPTPKTTCVCGAEPPTQAHGFVDTQAKAAEDRRVRSKVWRFVPQAKPWSVCRSNGEGAACVQTPMVANDLQRI